MIREPIQVADDVGVYGFRLGQAEDFPFTTPGDAACQMQLRALGAAAGQDETLQWPEVCVELIDLLFETRDLGGNDSQGLARFLVLGERPTEVGTEVEEIVLDSAEKGEDLLIGFEAGRDSYDRPELVT